MQQPHPPHPYGGDPPPPAPPRPPRNPYKRPVRVCVNIICGALLIMLLMMSTLPQVFYAVAEAFEIADEQVPGLVYWLVRIAVFGLSLLLPIVFIQVMTGIPARIAYPIHPAPPGLVVAGTFLCLGVSLVGQLVTGVLSLFFAAVFGLAPYAATAGAPAGGAEVAAYLFYAALLPAVCEELLFRGVILQTLRRYGDAFALVISSLLFGLMHGNLIQTPNAILLGLVMGYFVLRTGSLIPGVVFHLVNNLIVCAVNLVGFHSARWAAVINNLSYPLYILLAVIGLLWLQTGYGISFRLARSSYPLPEATKYGMFFSSGCAILLILACIAITATQFVRV